MSGWAARYIARLLGGASVTFRPHGHSMEPRIPSGALCTVAPAEEITAGDVVLCRVRQRDYLHLVLEIQNGRYRIGNARGGVNGWVRRGAIFGRVTHVQP
jgi:phage repressor protein C with HTH and peptisase S24 domain